MPAERLLHAATTVAAASSLMPRRALMPPRAALRYAPPAADAGICRGRLMPDLMS